MSWSRIDKGKGVAGQSGAPLSESVMGDDVQFPARGLALRKYFFSHVQETLGFDESSIFNFVAGWSEDRFINFLGMSITGQRNVLNSLLGIYSYISNSDFHGFYFLFIICYLSCFR